MRTERFFLLVITAAGLLFAALKGQADTLVKTDGTTLEGVFLGYGSGVFRFDDRAQSYEIPVADVFSVTLKPAVEEALNGVSYNLQLLSQRLDRIEQNMMQIEAGHRADTAAIQHQVYQLNPISKVFVERHEGEYQRSGTYRLTGSVHNGSAFSIRGISVQIDLLAADGSIVDSKTVPLSSSALSPGQSSLFRCEFESPSPFETYRITPVSPLAEPGVPDSEGFRLPNQ